MMNKLDLRPSFPTLLLVLMLGPIISGCQSAATLSMAVRSGDTVIIGLSGEEEALVTNTTSEVLRAQDVSATITDSGGNTATVKVRSVFKVYGDPTASVLAADRGQWLAVVDLVDVSNSALDLSTGPATLAIDSDKLIAPLNITTTILAGTGSPHALLGAENGLEKLGYLLPAQQALVSVSGDIGDAQLGAVQYQFSVSQEPIPTAFGPLSAIGSIKLAGRRDISYQSWTTPNPAGGTLLTVVMTAPAGVTTSDLRQLDIALVAGALSRSGNPASYFSNSLQSAVFYDINGEPMSGLQVAVGLVQ
jgi:hypothetical protein